jgi:hypothetical protein
MTHALDLLFSSEVELRPFTTSNINHIPEYGSILYTVFLDQKEFIYVGIGGLSGKSVRERNPRSRIIQHSQGRRSGDQFCIRISLRLHEVLSVDFHKSVCQLRLVRRLRLVSCLFPLVV